MGALGARALACPRGASRTAGQRFGTGMGASGQGGCGPRWPGGPTAVSTRRASVPARGSRDPVQPRGRGWRCSRPRRTYPELFFSRTFMPARQAWSSLAQLPTPSFYPCQTLLLAQRQACRPRRLGHVQDLVELRARLWARAKHCRVPC